MSQQLHQQTPDWIEKHFTQSNCQHFLSGSNVNPDNVHRELVNGRPIFNAGILFEQKLIV
jgi:hypothetical protein